MKAKQRKRVVYVAGAILVAVLGGLLFSSGQLVTQYHLFLLNYENSYLEDLLRGDPNELEGAAIEKYLQGVDGRERIVGLFLEAFQEKIRKKRSRQRLGEIVRGGFLVIDDSFL